jgi:acetyl esterase/lipase
VVHLPASFWRNVIRTVLRPALDPDLPIAEQRRRVALATRLLPHGTGVRIVPAKAGEPHGEWHRPPGAGPERVILYLHGGGFVLGSPRTHRPLASALAAAARAPVFVLDYRLAPEFPFPAALEDAVGAWESLNAALPGARRVAVAGDSAGGNLAVGVALEAARRGSPVCGLCLFSPWLDLSCAESTAAAAPADLMLGPDWVRACARLYLAGESADDPRASPGRAVPGGLPATLVQFTDAERLAPEIRGFCDRAREAGVDLRADQRPGLWHAWQGLGRALKPAAEALDDAGRFLRERLDLGK